MLYYVVPGYFIYFMTPMVLFFQYLNSLIKSNKSIIQLVSSEKQTRVAYSTKQWFVNQSNLESSH